MNYFYPEEYLKVYKNLGFMHPHVKKYRAEQYWKSHPDTIKNHLGRRTGKSTNACIDACFSILRNEHVLLVSSNKSEMLRKMEKISFILLEGFKVKEEELPLYMDKIQFEDIYNFKDSIRALGRVGEINRVSIPRKIFIDIE